MACFRISTKILHLCELQLTALFMIATCHTKLLPSPHKSCVHRTTMHPFTALFKATYVHLVLTFTDQTPLMGSQCCLRNNLLLSRVYKPFLRLKKNRKLMQHGSSHFLTLNLVQISTDFSLLAVFYQNEETDWSSTFQLQFTGCHFPHGRTV